MGASDACQRDRRWTVIATYSPTTPPAVDAIATGSCPMMPPVMSDSRESVPTSSGFAISRRGRPGELAATGAAGEEGCVQDRPIRVTPPAAPLSVPPHPDATGIVIKA